MHSGPWSKFSLPVRDGYSWTVQWTASTNDRPDVHRRRSVVAPEITFWKFHMAKTLVMDDIRFSILNWNENYEIKTVNVGFILVKYIMTD